MTPLPPGFSVTALAQLLDLTPRWVQKLARDGVIPKATRGLYSAEAVALYVRHLRHQAAGGAAADAFRIERTALVRVRRRHEGIKLRRLRGELLPADRVMRSVEVFARVWRDSLLALPMSAGEEVAAELDVAPQLVITALERIVRQFLEDMSRHTFKMADEAEGDGEER